LKSANCRQTIPAFGGRLSFLARRIYAAEGFVTSLFQMYPTVYLHKTTRGAEKLFQTMLLRVANLVADGAFAATGLPENHPLTNLFRGPENLATLADLDDSVVLGALPLLRQSDDPLVKEFSGRLQTRRLFKAIDLGPSIAAANVDQAGKYDERVFLKLQEQVTEKIEEWLKQPIATGAFSSMQRLASHTSRSKKRDR
jgi:hypothetical protein